MAYDRYKRSLRQTLTEIKRGAALLRSLFYQKQSKTNATLSKWKNNNIHDLLCFMIERELGVACYKYRNVPHVGLASLARGVDSDRIRIIRCSESESGF